MIDVPVVWVQKSSEQLAPGSDAWQHIAELSRRESAPLVQKTFGDSFEGADLEDVLARGGRPAGRRAGR